MRPTKTSLVILGTIVLLALTDAWLDNWMSHVWPLAAATWILLLLVEGGMLALQPILIERDLPDHLHLGQSVDIHYRVRNIRRLPLRMRTRDTLHPYFDGDRVSLDWSLAAHETQAQSSRYKIVGSGKIQLNNINASILGRLSLAWWDRNIAVPKSVRLDPDYRAGDTPVETGHSSDADDVSVQNYSSVTLVINCAPASELTIDGLRRIDEYVNHCTALACQAIHAHRMVNIILYDQKPLVVMLGLDSFPALQEFFSRFRQIESQARLMANHHCISDCLDKLITPGLLIWYSDLDDARQTAELAKIVRVLKLRFDVHLYDRVATETSVLDKDLREHCRSAYHTLAVSNIKHMWQLSRRLLRQQNIKLLRC